MPNIRPRIRPRTNSKESVYQQFSVTAPFLHWKVVGCDVTQKVGRLSDEGLYGFEAMPLNYSCVSVSVCVSVGFFCYDFFVVVCFCKYMHVKIDAC